CGPPPRRGWRLRRRCCSSPSSWAPMPISSRSLSTRNLLASCRRVGLRPPSRHVEKGSAHARTSSDSPSAAAAGLAACAEPAPACGAGLAGGGLGGFPFRASVEPRLWRLSDGALLSCPLHAARGGASLPGAAGDRGLPHHRPVLRPRPLCQEHP